MFGSQSFCVGYIGNYNLKSYEEYDVFWEWGIENRE